MNKEQAKSLVRWLITAFGAGLVGAVAATGLIDAETLLMLLNSEWFVGVLASGIALASGSLGWSFLQHTTTNTVATVASMSDQVLRDSGVVRILTADTAAGMKLAEATPGKVVVQAGPLSDTRRTA